VTVVKTLWTGTRLSTAPNPSFPSRRPRRHHRRRVIRAPGERPERSPHPAAGSFLRDHDGSHPPPRPVRPVAADHAGRLRDVLGSRTQGRKALGHRADGGAGGGPESCDRCRTGWIDRQAGAPDTRHRPEQPADETPSGGPRPRRGSGPRGGPSVPSTAADQGRGNRCRRGPDGEPGGGGGLVHHRRVRSTPHDTGPASCDHRAPTTGTVARAADGGLRTGVEWLPFVAGGALRARRRTGSRPSHRDPAGPGPKRQRHRVRRRQISGVRSRRGTRRTPAHRASGEGTATSGGTTNMPCTG
jgi:hypothetical protein